MRGRRLAPALRMGQIALFMGAAALAGCGFRAGLAPAAPVEPLPADALGSPQRLALEGLEAKARQGVNSRTIGVKIFGNESLLPNLERDLHEAFTNAARRHAALRLVSPERADLFIRGRIANFRRGAGVRTRSNRAIETIEIVTIEAELIDGATGRVLDRAQAQPSVGTAIDVPGREFEVRQRALDNAADGLLLLLLAGLEYGVTRPGGPLLPEVRAPLAETPRSPLEEEIQALPSQDDDSDT